MPQEQLNKTPALSLRLRFRAPRESVERLTERFAQHCCAFRSAAFEVLFDYPFGCFLSGCEAANAGRND
jgi:hypothetical protein